MNELSATELNVNAAGVYQPVFGNPYGPSIGIEYNSSADALEPLAWGFGGAIAGAKGGLDGAGLGFLGGVVGDIGNQFIHGTATIGFSL